MEKIEKVEILKKFIKSCKSFKYSIICLEKAVPQMIKSKSNILKIKDYFEDLFLFLDQYYILVYYTFNFDDEEINKYKEIFYNEYNETMIFISDSYDRFEKINISLIDNLIDKIIKM